MRVAHYGTFDVANFGDSLFPLILENRLPGHDFVHVSPLGGSSKYVDGRSSVAVRDAEGERFGAIIVGGGNTINNRSTPLADYKSISRSAYPSIWLGALTLAERHGVPLLVNGPSVSDALPGPGTRLLLKKLARDATYIAVRDSVSAGVLARVHPGSAIGVIPDTAFDVDRLWGRTERQRWVGRWDLEHVRTFTVSVKEKYIASYADAASAIDRIAARLEARPVLLALGQCHGDDQAQKRVGEFMGSDPLLVVPTALAEIAALIEHGVFYVGSSLHGAITGMAFGVPSVLVVGARPHHKFLGTLETATSDRRIGLVLDWVLAPDAVDRHRWGTKFNIPGVRERLDSHWFGMKEALAQGAASSTTKGMSTWRYASRLAQSADRLLSRL